MEEVQEARKSFGKEYDSAGRDPGQKEVWVHRRLVEAGYANVINAHDDPAMNSVNGHEPESLTRALGLEEDAYARYFSEQSRG